MSDRDPVGALGAKFSIPYTLAARLVLGQWGDCGVEAFREPALSDPRVRALARRVEVVEDPALTALTPRARPARVEVRLADGRVLVRQVDQPFGEFDRPYPESALREKFVALAAPDLGAGGRRVGLGPLPARRRAQERPRADRRSPRRSRSHPVTPALIRRNAWTSA